MDYEFTKGQKLIRSSIREFLKKECPSDKVRDLEEGEEGYDLEIWQKMAELGWLGMGFPEEYDGMEGDFIDLTIVMEELGKKLLPSPFFSTIALCALPILEYGSNKQKEKYLPGITSGKTIWTLALKESSHTYNFSDIKISAKKKGNDYHLSGSKIFVPYAHVADYLLVVAKDGDGISLIIVDTTLPGITIEVIPTTAHDKQCEIIFNGVTVPKENILGDPGRGWEIVSFIFQRGGVLKCAEMIGGVQAVLDLTNDYAKKRIQFGKPIGSFQAVQHRIANMCIDVEGLRYLVYEAVWKINSGSPSTLLNSMVKAKANEVYQRVCMEGIWVHGALGFTREQDIGLYHLRTKASEYTLGDSYFHKERIAKELEQYRPPILNFNDLNL